MKKNPRNSLPLKSAFHACLLLALLVPCTALMANAQTEPQIAESAVASGKYLLFEFFSNKTIESKIVRDVVINSGTASSIIKESYQLIPLEQGKDAEKESLYKITHYPTLIIAQPDGAEVDRIIGFRRPEEVAETLKAAAAGHSKIAGIRDAAAAPSAGIREHMALATALWMRDDLAGALKEYVWMLDNGGTADPKVYSAMYRLIVQQVASLGKIYPVAMDELSKRRDAAVIAAETDWPVPMALERAFAMNDSLGMASSNIPLYLKIPASSPLKQKLFSDIFLTLVREKKYQEIAEVADLEDFIGHIYPSFRENLENHAHGGHAHAQSERAAKQKVITYASAACETLIALGELEKAKRVAGHAIAFLGKDSQSLVARMDAIAAQSGVNAQDFLAWLTSYTQSTKPKSS